MTEVEKTIQKAKEVEKNQKEILKIHYENNIKYDSIVFDNIVNYIQY